MDAHTVQTRGPPASREAEFEESALARCLPPPHSPTPPYPTLLQGADPRAPAYHTLMSEMLCEAERGMHVQLRRLPFLEAARQLVACMGLCSVRHLAR